MAGFVRYPGRGVPLVDPETGRVSFYPEDQASSLIGSGWAPGTLEQIQQGESPSEVAPGQDKDKPHGPKRTPGPPETKSKP